MPDLKATIESGSASTILINNPPVLRKIADKTIYSIPLYEFFNDFSPL
jgi:hypothetical protein